MLPRVPLPTTPAELRLEHEVREFLVGMEIVGMDRNSEGRVTLYLRAEDGARARLRVEASLKEDRVRVAGAGDEELRLLPVVKLEGTRDGRGV